MLLVLNFKYLQRCHDGLGQRSRQHLIIYPMRSVNSPSAKQTRSRKIKCMVYFFIKIIKFIIFNLIKCYFMVGSYLFLLYLDTDIPKNHECFICLNSDYHFRDELRNLKIYSKT